MAKFVHRLFMESLNPHEYVLSRAMNAIDRGIVSRQEGQTLWRDERKTRRGHVTLAFPSPSCYIITSSIDYHDPHRLTKPIPRVA
jgi:hypothetical protein